MLLCFNVVQIHKQLRSLLLFLRIGMARINDAGLMTLEQYYCAENDLYGRMQLMMERECNHVDALFSSGDDSGDDSLDDPIVRSISTY